MKIKISLIALSVLATLLPAGTASAKTYRLEYFPPNGGYEYCSREPFPPEMGPANPTGTNFGAVCVPVKKGYRARVVKVVDDINSKVSLSWYWLDKNFVEVGKPSVYDDPASLTESGSNHGGGCDETRMQRAPKGARWFYVFIGSAAVAAIDDCADPGAFGTHGFITIRILK